MRPRARDYVDALHAHAGFEGDGSLDGDGVGGGNLLAGKAGQVLRGDGVDAVEGGDIVVAQDGWVGDAEAAASGAVAAVRLHDGPAEGSVQLVVLLRAGIDLGIIEAEDAAEGALQLKAHHGQQIGVGGAAAIEQNESVGGGSVGVDVVEPTSTPLFWQVSGWLVSWPKMASMTSRPRRR